ncbi:hypothetical protein J3U22_11990, partial [Gilliamella sp. B2865]
IGPPNNYWGDDDGDSGVTATGRLSLSIVDKNNRPVSRDTVLTTCTDSAPYRVTLSSTDGTLSTRYGFPNRSTFSARNVTYYVNPKAAVCFARPNLKNGKLGDDISTTWDFAGPASMWDPANGFIPQSNGPSSYGLNFPTTGANGLYFDLLIGGVNQPLSWSPVSLGGITATMSNPTATSVRVTLTGPYATPSQISSANPGPLSTISLPQTFELVGRDNNGNPVIKYGFTLKQWFVNRGSKTEMYPQTLSWCNSLGYRLPRARDLSNASCRNSNPDYVCHGSVGALPSSPDDHYMRHIGSGFFTEWGRMYDYSGVGFYSDWYWTSDPYDGRRQFVVDTFAGSIDRYDNTIYYVLCAYP